MDGNELKIKSITPAELLGRLLNEVEAKYAPKTLYVSGSLEIPLRGIRVAVIGTRKPSNEGIE
ncbi:MAG: DNA-processing protein DprA, partial [Archaeoglobaceae archaeon]